VDRRKESGMEQGIQRGRGAIGLLKLR
jgi:hypothetical protein